MLGTPLILLVEPDDVLAAATLEVLRANYGKGVRAKDGTDALAQLRAGLIPDLVLLDMHNPKAGGTALLTALLIDGDLDDIAVVLMVGNRFEPIHPRALGKLVKPYDTKQLLSAVEEHTTTLRLSAAAGAPSSVLVVDDDAELRRVICDLLTEHGYSALGVANGSEALQLLQDPSTERPKLILLDLMMPVMDGWEFLERVASDQRIASVPIIIMSAYLNVQKTRSHALVPSRPKVEKPFRMSELLGMIEINCATRGTV